MELLISVSASDVLYHVTNLSAAVKIVEQDKFHLKPNEGTEAESMLSKPTYYLSTTRTRIGSYSRQHVWSYSVVFVLDGQKLGQRYRIKPVDYWETLKDATPYASDNPYNKRRERNESEDRVFSKNPTIPAFKYLREIHACINDKKNLLFALKKAALKHRVKIWFYSESKDLLMLDKRKAVPITFNSNDLKVVHKPREYDFKYRMRENSIKPWIQLWFAPIRDNDPYKTAKALGDKAYTCYQRLRYSDAINGFNADLHNAKGANFGETSKEREMLDSLIAVMRKNKLTPQTFLKALFDKFYPRTQP